jgi:hypothetical protein
VIGIRLGGLSDSPRKEAVVTPTRAGGKLS